MKQIYENYYITEDGKLYNKYNKQLSASDNGRGYLIYNVIINGKSTSKAIHRLIAEAFIPNPNSFPEVNHKDANRKNNSIDNLEWCSHGYNIKYSFDLKNRSALGENNANCKNSIDKVVEICELLEQGYKPSLIRDLGYSYSLVRQIKARKNWKHISHIYNF